MVTACSCLTHLYLGAFALYWEVRVRCVERVTSWMRVDRGCWMQMKELRVRRQWRVVSDCKAVEKAKSLRPRSVGLACEKKKKPNWGQGKAREKGKRK